MHAPPIVDLSVQHGHIAEEAEAGFAEALATDDFAGGSALAALEQEHADFGGARCCVGVANGTDTLEMALRAHAIGTGDEVVLPANKFIATAKAVARAGGRAVCVDVDDDPHEHGWHLCVVRVVDRDEALHPAGAQGIGARGHYPTPVHLTPAMGEFAAVKGSVPVSEHAAGEILSLPIHPGIMVEQQERVADVVCKRAGCRQGLSVEPTFPKVPKP